MIINFDLLNRYEFPQIKLCRPDRTGQCYLNNYRHLIIKLNFNAASEVSFEIDRIYASSTSPTPQITNGYDSIFSDKLLYLGPTFKWFIITEAKIQTDGTHEYKSVTALSY